MAFPAAAFAVTIATSYLNHVNAPDKKSADTVVDDIRTDVDTILFGGHFGWTRKATR